MTTEHFFQLVLILVNALSVVAFRSLKGDIAHVKEILNEKHGFLEKRIEKVESKCSSCPVIE